MYEIIATKDFIEVLKKLSLEYLHVLTHSFVSMKVIPEQQMDNTFLDDLFCQLHKQEVDENVI